MQIAVVCPHCESRFQLGSELLGKSMRCPACRDVFTVIAETAPDSPAAVGHVNDFLPVVESVSTPNDPPFERIENNTIDLPTMVPEPAPSSKPIPTAKPAADPVATSPPKAASVPTAKPIPVATARPGPKEVAWSEDAAPPVPIAAPIPARPASASSPNGPAPASPAPVPATRSRRGAAPVDDGDFIRTRPTGRRWTKPLAFGLAFAILATLGVTAFMLLRFYTLTEQNLLTEAEEDYKSANYSAAQQKYEQLLADFPESAEKARYHFFARICTVQSTVGSVSARENPEPPRAAFEAFLSEFKDSPFVHPESGYGADVVQLGKRLADTIADYANDQLTAFRADRSTITPLDRSEQATAEGLTLLPEIDRYRRKDGLPLDDVKLKFEKLGEDQAKERHRLAVLLPFRDLAKNPHADDIEKFQVVLRENKLGDDAEARAMIVAAEKRIRELTVFTPSDGPAPPLPPAPRTTIFSAPVPGSPTPRVTPEMPADVVFSVAGGVLYALDSRSGALLWGVPIGPMTADPGIADLPLRVSLAGGLNDGVLIAGEWAGAPALTARMAHTGEIRWYQPLKALPLTRPVPAGGRVYVPLRDRNGTVVEFDRATGERFGEFTIRQPISGGMAVLPGTTPGVSYLFVPGDTRRVFVFEVGREDKFGRRLAPRVARVLLTEHPKDSLRGEPLLITPIEENGPRLLVLTQTDGPTTTRLRTFPIPPPEQFAPVDGAPTEELAQRSNDVPIPGWTWFPAKTNGERVVLATDAGAFLALGVNQTGNLDRPLFPIPSPVPTKDQQEVSRSMVVAATEDSFWAVLHQRLIQLRTAIDPVAGLRIVPQGLGRGVGEPLHRADLLPADDLGVITVRPDGSGRVQAVAFDTSTGQIRWQTWLGMIPVASPIVRDSGPPLVVAADGSIFRMPTESDNAVSPSIVAERLALPIALPGETDITQIAASEDGRTLCVLTPFTQPDGRKLHVRWVEAGEVKQDRTMTLPDAPAGPPVIAGSQVLIPLANGYIYRLGAESPSLQVGPLWRGETREAMPRCFLTPINESEFLATDGGRSVIHWQWPTDPPTATAKKQGGPWECRTAIASAPVVLPGASLRFAVVETSGRVSLYEPEKSATAVRHWPSAEGSRIPDGTPSDRLVLAHRKGKPLLIYGVDRKHLVAIDPAEADAVWVASDLLPSDFGGWIGWTVREDRIVVTGLTGRLVTLNAETGKDIPEQSVEPIGLVAAKPAVLEAPGRCRLLLQNGTGVMLP